jgi:hypothetical protein
MECLEEFQAASKFQIFWAIQGLNISFGVPKFLPKNFRLPPSPRPPFLFFLPSTEPHYPKAYVYWALPKKYFMLRRNPLLGFFVDWGIKTLKSRKSLKGNSVP